MGVRQLKRRVNAHYMRKQSDITPDMRAIMVDWLVEVGVEYHLAPLTLHVCVRRRAWAYFAGG